MGPGGDAAARPARRSLTVWLVSCAVGAGLVLLAAGRTWATVTFTGQAGPIGAGKVSLAGGDLVAWLTPASLAALAATAAVLATGGVARRVIGALITLLGIAVLVACWNGTRGQTIASAAGEHTRSVVVSTEHMVAESRPWPLVAVAGGLVLIGGGAVVAVRGGRWPGMSSRYDRPGGGSRTEGGPGDRSARGRRTGERAMWDAIDEGIDPTRD